MRAQRPTKRTGRTGPPERAARHEAEAPYAAAPHRPDPATTGPATGPGADPADAAEPGAAAWSGTELPGSGGTGGPGRDGGGRGGRGGRGGGQDRPGGPGGGGEGGGRRRARGRRAERRRTARRHAMAAAASVVVAVGTVSGLLAATGGDRDDSARPRPEVSASALPVPLPARPSPTAASPSPSPTPSRTPAKPSAAPRPKPSVTKKRAPRAPAPRTVSAALYRHPESQVLDWVRANPGDPRRPVIESRIADQPAAVWFAEYDPGAITGRVRAVTSGAAAAGRVPVLVPYAIPDRDCGGASQGGAPDLDAYDGWIRNFADGLGSGPVIVVLEPDSIALADCLSDGQRAARYASLARAGKALRAANPQAKVYFDAGHSGWHSAAKMAGALREAGAATSSDGIFTNVSNFHGTADEAAYARRVLTALGGPSHLGAVIDTSRNGNGAPAPGEWCDPAGRALGRTPTTRTGEARIDAYLWIKLPGESDGCSGAAGEFSADYAYDLATG